MKILKHILYWVLYSISFIPKRNKKIWVFGSNKTTFNDNAKYLFIDIYSKKIPVRAIWISLNKALVKELSAMGYESYYTYSLKGIYYSLNCGVSVFSHSFMGVSVFCGGSIKIGLWHGIPLKKMGHDIVEQAGIERITSYLSLNHKHAYDLFLSTSDVFTNKMSFAYEIPKKAFFVAKYPRLKPIFEKNNIPYLESIVLPKEKDVFEDLKINYAKRYLYMPTWRDDDSDFLDNAIKDFTIINKIMIAKNTVFIIKGHELGNNQYNESQLTNIKFISSSTDIYPFLPYVDCLITDYSSIFFDFYFTQKPIIFYSFDYEKYTKYRGLYFEYLDVCIGNHVNTFEELCDTLDKEITISIENEVKINQLIKLFWHNAEWDDNASLINKIQLLS